MFSFKRKDAHESQTSLYPRGLNRHFPSLVLGGQITVDFGLDWGAPPDQTELTTQLEKFGLVFSSESEAGGFYPGTVDGVTWFGTDPDYGSYSYCISPGFKDDGYGSTEPIRVDFDPLASEVSVRGFDGGGDTDTMVLSAYDLDGILVDSANLTSVFSSPGSVLSVEWPEIAYVTFHVEGTHSGLFYDDLTYTLVPVPEPSTALIVFVGSLALAARCRPTHVACDVKLKGKK